MTALLLALCLGVSPTSDGPIRLHPENPHYLQWRGRPTLLVTSGEHYGAVLNLDFDFEPYLDALARDGLNLTRTFAGTYRELADSFGIQNNPLAPKPNRYLAPWKKVADATDDTPERYDLDQFDPAYFERLNQFIKAADERGVVVELVLFCPLYPKQPALWRVNPMNPGNNINNLGDIPSDEVYTLKHPALLDRQLDYVRKVVTALNDHDNLYYEICNEPYFGGVTLDWQERVARTIALTEADLPRHHLIAQNIANGKQRVEQPAHPEVDILNFHYAEPAAALENLGLKRALGDDETGFDGNDDRAYRTEAWLFLLSGGSIFSNLDYSFTPDTEDGTAVVQKPTPGGGGPRLRSQIGRLKRFIEDLNFLAMRPAPELLKGRRPNTLQTALLCQPDVQYAFYVNQARDAMVELDLPAGRFRYEWIDPTGSLENRQGVIDHVGGLHVIKPPPYAEDAALRLDREGTRPATRGVGLMRPGQVRRVSRRVDPQPTALPRLQVSDNHRFLQTETGEPFFYLADTAWELFHRLDRDEADRYLKDRAAKGFNVVQAVVLAELDGLHTPNAYGQTPLRDDDPTRPNEAYFEHVDWIVHRAAELGIYTAMLPTWGDKVNRLWGTGPVVFTPENAERYGEYLGRRYRDAPIIWVLGGDRPVDNDTHAAIWNAMARGIRRGDGGRHLITFHPVGGKSSADWFHDAPWLDFNMLQSGHAKRDLPNDEAIRRDYARTPVKPCLDGEPRYEDHPIDWKPDNGWFDEHDVRKALYAAVFAGGCGVTYGCHDIWQMWEDGRPPISHARTAWFEALSLPGSTQAGYLKRLLLSRPYFNRIPDQGLLVSSNEGDRPGPLATRGQDGAYALVYLPENRPVTIDLTRLSGKSLRVWWFDPRKGEAREAEQVARKGSHPFTPPQGGPDWVLVLDDADRGFGPPGQP